MERQLGIIGDNVRRLRTHHKYSQEEFALLAGVSLSSFRKIENGTGNPTLYSLYLISKALSVPFEAILYPQHNNAKKLQEFIDTVALLPEDKIDALVNLLVSILNIMKIDLQKEQNR